MDERICPYCGQSSKTVFVYGHEQCVCCKMNIKDSCPKKESNMDERICPYCGQSSKTVFVHGHEQCVVCKTNVEPCCQGQVLKGGRDE